MNDGFASTLYMGVMFVLRCMIPLGILFGISYLLRRMELVNDEPAAEPIPDAGEEPDQADDEEADPALESSEASEKPAARKPVPAKNKTSSAKKKSAASKKKES